MEIFQFLLKIPLRYHERFSTMKKYQLLSWQLKKVTPYCRHLRTELVTKVKTKHLLMRSTTSHSTLRVVLPFIVGLSVKRCRILSCVKVHDVGSLLRHYGPHLRPISTFSRLKMGPKRFESSRDRWLRKGRKETQPLIHPYGTKDGIPNTFLV